MYTEYKNLKSNLMQIQVGQRAGSADYNLKQTTGTNQQSHGKKCGLVWTVTTVYTPGLPTGAVGSVGSSLSSLCVTCA